MMAAPNLSMVAEIKIQLMDDGSLGISGQISDKAFALKLLDHAADAIRNTNFPGQVRIPNRDVALAPPAYAQRALGDIPASQRGDAG
jgi:hypothetical protein